MHGQPRLNLKELVYYGILLSKLCRVPDKLFSSSTRYYCGPFELDILQIESYIGPYELNFIVIVKLQTESYVDEIMSLVVRHCWFIVFA